MIPGAFDYYAPETLEEAIDLLSRHRPDAKVLAGGQSLIPALRFRLSSPAVLVDINRVQELEYIRPENGFLSIGALTRESALESSRELADKYPLLTDAAGVIADPLVRNRATVGGNLAHADPANDHPAVMLAYGAELTAQGPSGKRRISIDDFFVDLFENSLQDGEILTGIRIPAPRPGAGGAYFKVERKVGDYAVSAVAVQLQMDGPVCRDVRIGLTNVSPTPMRATGAEGALKGQELTDEAIERAARSAAAECDPSPDLRGPVEYKRDLTRVLVKRALRKAAERAKGGAS